MGWPPKATLGSTSFELWAAWLAWKKFNGAEEKEPLSRRELDELLRSTGLGNGE